MGKVKQQLTEDMMLNPENYNNPDPTEEEVKNIDYDTKEQEHIEASFDKDEIENVKEDNRRDTL